MSTPKQTLVEKFEILTDAARKNQKVELHRFSKWEQIDAPSAAMYLSCKIRSIDPYRELKQAHAAGKAIQFRYLESDEWATIVTPTWDYEADCYRIKPDWTLPRHIKGFRSLTDDENWHQLNSWTENMLPPNWRPLLTTESHRIGDHFLSPFGNQWRTCSSDHYEYTADKYVACYRTQRPLPTLPPLKETVVLEPADIPPGSIVRSPRTSVNGWVAIVAVGDNGVTIASSNDEISFKRMLAYEWQIKRPGEDWAPCSKEITIENTK